MGKSASGKDTIYKRLIADAELGLERVVPYTTRPIREKEVEGNEYHFVSEEEYLKLSAEGKILEERAYETVHGLWRYFTVGDSRFYDELGNKSILIGTLETYVSLCRAIGKDKFIPIYIEADDGDRLERSIKRERKEEIPKYAEVCRRFLADTEDFSEDKLFEAGILPENRFVNINLEECVTAVREYILSV